MTTPIPLRAHQVLCLQGFEGKGYSHAFIRAMEAVHGTLAANAEQPVALQTEPDRLCAACPHGVTSGCTLGGPRHEAHMRAQDEEVLRRLGLEAGVPYPWASVLERIRGAIRSSDLPEICTTCPWLPLGMCAAGLDRLRSSSGGE